MDRDDEEYYDDEYEYRHVIVPKEYMKFIPKGHLMTESEWRNIGIAQVCVDLCAYE